MSKFFCPNQPNTGGHPRLKSLVAKIQTLGGQGSSFINTTCLEQHRGKAAANSNLQKQPAKHKKIAQQYPAKDIHIAIIIILFPSLKTNTTQHHNTTHHQNRTQHVNHSDQSQTNIQTAPKITKRKYNFFLLFSFRSRPI